MAEAEANADYSKYVAAPLLQIPQRPLEGQAAFVTGGTGINKDGIPNIGLAIGERLAFDGISHLFLVGTENSRERIPFIEERLRQYGAIPHVLIGDITSQESRQSMMTEAYETAGGNIHVLVNNAGVNVNKNFLEVTEEDWDSVMDPKTKAAFFLTQVWFLIRVGQTPAIRGGRVINISSVAGIDGNSGQTPYVAANFAMNGLTRAGALEMGAYGVTVNSVAPIFVEGTNMANEVADALEPAKAVTPLGQFPNPRDVAAAVAFLAGPDGAKISGAVLAIDGAAHSNYTALPGLFKAGFRQVPRFALSIVPNMSREEVGLIQAHRAQGGANA